MTGDNEENVSVDDTGDGPGGHFSDTTTDYERRSDYEYPSKQRRRSRRRHRTGSVSALSCHSVSLRYNMPSAVVVTTMDDGDDGGDDGGGGDGDEEQNTKNKTFSFWSQPREKKMTLINFCATNMSIGCFYSLLGPFFPNEAAKKGVNATLVGLILGSFELIVVLLSPIIGIFKDVAYLVWRAFQRYNGQVAMWTGQLTRIGAKFTYTSGVFVLGCGSILFGFLDGCPDGAVYIVMCFLVRTVEAVGAAALSTASFAILANTFPDNVATVFGSLELFMGLGLMIGPPLGGVLFQELGGFKLPFISLGCFMLVVTVITMWVMPSQDFAHRRSTGSIFTLLRIPIIPIVGLCLMSGQASIGFINVALSIFLDEQYGLGPAVVGFVFLIVPGMYAFAAPFWGWVVDRTPKYNTFLICIGYTIAGVGFYLMGPAPFLRIPHQLWLVIVSLIMMGIGISTLVISFQVITEATMSAGYPENLDTYALIAGVFNACSSFGAFIGPLGGGYLRDLLDFELSAAVIGSVSLFASAVMLLSIVVGRCRQKSELPLSAVKVDKCEQQPLLADTSLTLRCYSSDTEPTRATKSSSIKQQECTRA